MRRKIAVRCANQYCGHTFRAIVPTSGVVQCLACKVENVYKEGGLRLRKDTERLGEEIRVGG
jgi:hypothetical protein